MGSRWDAGSPWDTRSPGDRGNLLGQLGCGQPMTSGHPTRSGQPMGCGSCAQLVSLGAFYRVGESRHAPRRWPHAEGSSCRAARHVRRLVRGPARMHDDPPTNCPAPGQVWSTSVRCWPRLANDCQNTAKFGRKCQDGYWPNLHVTPSLAEFGQILARRRLNFGPIRANFGPILIKSGRSWPNLAEPVSNLTAFGQISQDSKSSSGFPIHGDSRSCPSCRHRGRPRIPRRSSETRRCS